jgi:hypothetical protein
LKSVSSIKKKKKRKKKEKRKKEKLLPFTLYSGGINRRGVPQYVPGSHGEAIES